MTKIRLIYNPHAGAKKRMFRSHDTLATLKSIHHVLYKYEIQVDEVPTKAPGDARILAAQAAAEKYDLVIVAGGDGTVGEAANGLVGTETALGILPFGTYMNVARMLAIPSDLERAVMLIKLGNVRSIDVGKISPLNGTENQPHYFIETVGIGLEADFQRQVVHWEGGNWKAIIRRLKKGRAFYPSPMKIELDGGKSFETRAHVVLVSNGPYEGAGLAVAPTAKLNDHQLTVRCYRMTRRQLFYHLLRLKLDKKRYDPLISTNTSSFVRITAAEPRPLHADARIFGSTPVEMTVVPAALRVITGFPEHPDEAALLKEDVYLES